MNVIEARCSRGRCCFVGAHNTLAHVSQEFELSVSVDSHTWGSLNTVISGEISQWACWTLQRHHLWHYLPLKFHTSPPVLRISFNSDLVWFDDLSKHRPMRWAQPTVGKKDGKAFTDWFWWFGFSFSAHREDNSQFLLLCYANTHIIDKWSLLGCSCSVVPIVDVKRLQLQLH